MKSLTSKGQVISGNTVFLEMYSEYGSTWMWVLYQGFTGNWEQAHLLAHTSVHITSFYLHRALPADSRHLKSYKKDFEVQTFLFTTLKCLHFVINRYLFQRSWPAGPEGSIKCRSKRLFYNVQTCSSLKCWCLQKNVDLLLDKSK